MVARSTEQAEKNQIVPNRHGTPDHRIHPPLAGDINCGSPAKWDRRFLDLARLVAGWSRDPSTKVGACLVDQRRRVISVGFNGLAQSVEDLPARYENRDVKLRMIIHAEMNALAFANRDLRGCTLYTWPFMPCARCAALIVQHGIKRVVAPQASAELQERWAEDLDLTQIMFKEAVCETGDCELWLRKHTILTKNYGSCSKRLARAQRATIRMGSMQCFAQPRPIRGKQLTMIDISLPLITS